MFVYKSLYFIDIQFGHLEKATLHSKDFPRPLDLTSSAMKSVLLLFELPRLAVAGSVVQILPGGKAGKNKIDQIIIFLYSLKMISPK